MFDSSDLDPCPACGGREFHAIRSLRPQSELAEVPPIEEQLQNTLRTFYACKNCGRDRTDAVEAVPNEGRPGPEPIIGPPGSREKISDKMTIAEETHALGIAAQLKNGELQ